MIPEYRGHSVVRGKAAKAFCCNASRDRGETPNQLWGREDLGDSCGEGNGNTALIEVYSASMILGSRLLDVAYHRL